MGGRSLFPHWLPQKTKARPMPFATSGTDVVHCTWEILFRITLQVLSNSRYLKFKKHSLLYYRGRHIYIKKTRIEKLAFKMATVSGNVRNAGRGFLC
ncbi:unnamed protein product [Ixodes pacificus]